MPNCKNCQKEFSISAWEKEFLGRISPKIGEEKFALPEPEFCPDCRLRMRTSYRNEQYLYKNKSTLSGQEVISLYSPRAPWGEKFVIYSPEEWWSDKWDGLAYGQDFDFNRPFFEQFYELSLKLPKMSLMQTNNVNSPYTTGTGFCKNCHLINCSENTEDSYYGKLVQSSRDIMDSDFVYDSELCYGCFNVTNCYNCIHVSYSQNCHDCYFCENLRGCDNCFLCTNLVNKEYHFKNEPISKEEYEKKKAEYLGSRTNLDKAKEILKVLRRKRIYKYAALVNCQDSSGDFLTNCKNCLDCFDMNDSEDCQYVIVGVNVKDLLDCSNMYLKQEFCYQVLGTINIYDVIFSLYIFYCSHIIYSEHCWNSKNLFGCSSLRHKEYCIFNKQYTEEEYKKLVPKIIAHMKKTGEWGQYFPIKYAPFGHNESVAQDYLPLTKEAAQAAGYNWLEIDKSEYQPSSYQMPDSIAEVPDDVVKQILACVNCGRNYKVIKQELARLRLLKLPVPLKCPNCRQQERMAMRNPRRIYDRQCAKCGKDIKTTFATDRPETIYCEECYRDEIY